MTNGTIATQAYFTDEMLASIKSFDDALAIAAAAGELESISDYGNGFSVLKDKGTLVGVPFVILEWQEREGDFADSGFMSALVVTKGGEKWVVNDGSTGIADQLREVTRRRESEGRNNPRAFLSVPGGLTRSDYFRNETTGDIARTRPEGAPKGEWIPATTFYLA